jgi:hypothetical protein
MGQTLSLSLSVVAIRGHGVLPSAVAQVSGNSLDGIVHDHSRTVVVAVALILVETSTKTEYKEKTEEDCSYNFVGLSMGKYT